MATEGMAILSEAMEPGQGPELGHRLPQVDHHHDLEQCHDQDDHQHNNREYDLLTQVDYHDLEQYHDQDDDHDHDQDYDLDYHQGDYREYDKNFVYGAFPFIKTHSFMANVHHKSMGKGN